MSDDQTGFQVHRCGACGKPTPASRGYCLHCKASFATGQPVDWWSRNFDSGPTAKKGCLIFAVVLIVVVFLLVGRCTQSRLEADRSAVAAAAEQRARDDAERAENQRKGFHCLSTIDGSQLDLVDAVKKGLRDPDSYQHIETRITPANARGQHQLMMHYRARNGFGGMMDGVVTATVDTATCKVHVIDSE